MEGIELSDILALCMSGIALVVSIVGMIVSYKQNKWLNSSAYQSAERVKPDFDTLFSALSQIRDKGTVRTAGLDLGEHDPAHQSQELLGRGDPIRGEHFVPRSLHNAPVSHSHDRVIGPVSRRHVREVRRLIGQGRYNQPQGHDCRQHEGQDFVLHTFSSFLRVRSARYPGGKTGP